MGIHEREPMPSGHTPAAQAITKPGEAGATTDKNARDEAVIKLAESFGELAREAAEALRTERETIRIRTYNVRKWLEQIAVALHAHLEEKGTTFDDVVNGDGTYKVDSWWWDVYEGIFYELNDEIDPPVTLPRPVAEYKRKEEQNRVRSGDYVKNDDVLKALDQMVQGGELDREAASAIRNDLGLAGMSIDD